MRRDLHANAAQAALNIQEWESAAAFATEVLKVEPKHPKALYRRAAAWLGRGADGDGELAVSDLERLIELQPANAAAIKLMARARAEAEGYMTMA